MKPRRGKAAGAASPTSYDEALQMLVRRERSTRELVDGLTRRGHAPAEADAAIARLRAEHYQSDERFAAALARQRASQGYGPLRIRAELRSHAIDATAIQAALDGLDADWAMAAAAQLRRHAGGKPATSATERARRAAFLLRRGFDAATVRALTRAQWADSDGESD